MRIASLLILTAFSLIIACTDSNTNNQKTPIKPEESHPKEVPATIQERALSSPIWYQPKE